MGRHGRASQIRPDLAFWFDPVCPFAWLTSEWVRQVADAKDYRVEWKLISLRILNAHRDYAAEFPPQYPTIHEAGLKLLRVAAAVRAKEGPEPLGALYREFGSRIHDVEHPGGYDLGLAKLVTAAGTAPMLAAVGLPRDYAEALEDTAWDDALRAETEHALSLTGKDVGTPIIQVDPPTGIAFFGPVISRRPSPEEAVELWDAVLTLARFPGFAELKRSLREQPQLPAGGVAENEIGKLEDWHGGSRRLKR